MGREGNTASESQGAEARCRDSQSKVVTKHDILRLERFRCTSHHENGSLFGCTRHPMLFVYVLQWSAQVMMMIFWLGEALNTKKKKKKKKKKFFSFYTTA